jgi:hypothetical protein
MKILTKRQAGRRTLLAGAGASGLAMAAAVFGRGSPALAANYGCCQLAFNPPNVSYATCRDANYNYIWNCIFGTVGPRYRYSCCERYKNADRQEYNASAAKRTCISGCG